MTNRAAMYLCMNAWERLADDRKEDWVQWQQTADEMQQLQTAREASATLSSSPNPLRAPPEGQPHA